MTLVTPYKMKAASLHRDHHHDRHLQSCARTLDLELSAFSTPDHILDHIVSHRVDLLFADCDLHDAFGTAEFVRSVLRIRKDLPILLFASPGCHNRILTEMRELGVADVISRPIRPGEFQNRVRGLKRILMEHMRLQIQTVLLEEQLNRTSENVLQCEMESLRILSRATGYRSLETREHLNRVAHYSRLIASLLGLDIKYQDTIFHAAPLHDIGKLGIPDELLLKEEKLTPFEFELMKNHTKIGHNLLKRTQSRYLQAGALIALTHHEKYDGSGYPSGRKGDSIPLLGRIVAVADVFDALTSDRPYKRSWKLEESFTHIRREAGYHFDPEIVRTFLAGEGEVRKLYESFLSPDRDSMIVTI